MDAKFSLVTHSLVRAIIHLPVSHSEHSLIRKVQVMPVYACILINLTDWQVIPFSDFIQTHAECPIDSRPASDPEEQSHETRVRLSDERRTEY